MAVAISGSAILVRALYGPVEWIRLNSPMNAGGCFALAVLLCLSARTQADIKDRDSAGPKPTLGMWIGLLALISLPVAVFWKSLHFYFLSDDFVILKTVGSKELTVQWTSLGGDGFYRPVSHLCQALNSRWSGLDTFSWHVSSLVLHLANTLLVFGLALRVCSSRLAAWFAASLFAIHATRPEAAVWLAGSPDLTAAFFLLCGLLLFIRSVDNLRARSNWYRFTSLVCMTLAILSKEVAYAFPLLILAYQISTRGLRREKIGLMAPFFAVATGLLCLRLLFLGGIGGYKVVETGRPQVLDLSLVLSMKALLLRVWAALFFPINWNSQPRVFLGIALVVYLSALIWLAFASVDRRRSIFPLSLVLACSLPPLQLMLIGPDLLKSRLLYLPSVGFCLLLALAVEKLRIRSRWVVITILLVFNVAALEHNLAAWRYASEKSESACNLAAECVGPGTRKIVAAGLPMAIRGVYFFGNGFPEGVQMRGVSVPIELRERPESVRGAAGVCTLVWDRSSEELRVVSRGD
jgi:hypothetical protein